MGLSISGGDSHVLHVLLVQLLDKVDTHSNALSYCCMEA